MSSGCACRLLFDLQQEYPAATMKHLLAKNGSRKMPEVDDDLQCEKLLNSLAKQQKQQQSATDKSLPPSKRQRLLGVNENNQVIIADSPSGPSDALPNKPLSSPPNRLVMAFFAVPGKAIVSQSQVPAPTNSCVDVTNAPLKSAVAAEQQPSNNQADPAHDIVCIDDDEDDDDPVIVLTDSPKKANGCAVPLVTAKIAEPPCQKMPVASKSSSAVSSTINDDDSVVVLTDSPKAEGHAVMPVVSAKNAESPCQKMPSNPVASKSSSTVSAAGSSTDLHSVESSVNNCAGVSVNRDDAADSEHFASLSSVDGQHHHG